MGGASMTAGRSNIGDWKLDPQKFPGGDADMRRLVGPIHDAGLKARLWLAPLAVAPGIRPAARPHGHAAARQGRRRPERSPGGTASTCARRTNQTVDYTLSLVRKFIGEWGYAGLKIDGQHLNGVAPCYNPAHKHARPEESFEKLQDFFQAVYDTATQVNPQAVVELCPCGTSYSFFNFPYINQAPASDPRVLLAGAPQGQDPQGADGTERRRSPAITSSSAIGGDDFASTVGIGAVVSTKFTWPVDPKPKDSFLLTPERESDVAQVDRALQGARCCRKGTIAANCTTSASTSRKPTSVEKTGRSTMLSMRRAGTGRSSCAGSAPGATGCATTSTSANWASRRPGSRPVLHIDLRTFPVD